MGRVGPGRLPIDRSLIVWCAVSCAALAALAFSGCEDPRRSDWIYGNGRIEGNEVRVAAEIPGRIVNLPVREGEHVEKGQLLAELSSDELQDRLRGAAAAVKAAQAGLEQLEAKLSALRHHEETARAEEKRVKTLFRSGVATPQQRDQAENALREVEGQRKTAENREVQLQAEVEAARAAESLARTQLSKARILSPLSGIVLLRVAERGEVAEPGRPLLVIVDPGDLFLKVYIAEKEIGMVRLGNPARVKVDAFPDRTFEGTVSKIGQQAEFTPKDVHMPEERTQLVFSANIRLKNPEGFLKPGMPADAEIRWKASDDKGA
jgi:HlyD family secretion protein